MDSTRRSFVIQAAGFASTLAIMKSTSAAAPAPDLIARMSWLNAPASWKRVGDKLIVHSRPKSDFWRKTHTGDIRDNGHFFHLKANGDFTLQAHINGQYAAEFDQAGLMVRVNAENWMKCGTEFFAGKRRASVVFTRDFSDWSTMPDLTETGPVWWRAVRYGESLQTWCSLDGKDFAFVRDGYLPGSSAEVGIMCAAPDGPGFEAEFDQISLSFENLEKNKPV